MLFEIHAEKSSSEQKIFYYDNQTNVLTDDSGKTYRFDNVQDLGFTPSTSFSKDKPLKKSKQITTLKIQLGLSCNYSCDYCSQKFVERAPETSQKDIDAFIAMLDTLEFSEEKGLKIEFWGGEPLVYWKTLKPLTEAIQIKFSHWRQDPQFLMITNGSLLTQEICDWLVLKGFQVAISHDGPGQHVRGPDPLDDPETKKVILDFYRVMRKYNRISFNACLNSKNTSRKAIHDFFVELTGDPEVPLGEGGLIDSYDDDGVANSMHTKQQHFDFRRQAIGELLSGHIGFESQVEKVKQFCMAVMSGYQADFLGQKCGMDKEYALTVDLRGNVITCQNVSSVQVAPNGESHLGGNLNDYDNVSLKSATHWKERDNCKNCPVLHLCRGSCMFLEGDLWDTSCENSYSDNVVFFALAINELTGYIPYLIKADGLPLHRQDIFGTVFEHRENPNKRTIPIKVLS